jgi:hypothetical protein
MLEKLKAALAETTQGEWRPSMFGSCPYGLVIVKGRPIFTVLYAIEEEANARFVGLAHNFIPDLLRLVELQTRLIDHLYAYGPANPATMAAMGELHRLKETLKC